MCAVQKLLGMSATGSSKSSGLTIAPVIDKVMGMSFWDGFFKAAGGTNTLTKQIVKAKPFAKAVSDEIIRVKPGAPVRISGGGRKQVTNLRQTEARTAVDVTKPLPPSTTAVAAKQRAELNPATKMPLEGVGHQRQISNTLGRYDMYGKTR
jgi:hypothetical protein